MNKTIAVLSGLMLINLTVNAQVLCVQCFKQNAPISSTQTNLLQNPGFESHNCIPQNWFNSSYCPNSSYYNCDIQNWTVTGGGSSTYADMVTNQYAYVAEGTYAVYMGNNYCRMCSSMAGDTSCLEQVDCAVTGIPEGYPSHTADYGGQTGVNLQQTVTGLIVGGAYVLEFWAGGEANQYGAGVFAVDVGFGDTLLRNDPTPTIGGIGIRYRIAFIASSTEHVIKFTNWGHITTLSTELILDDVKMYPYSIAEGSPCELSTDVSEELITTPLPFLDPSTNILHLAATPNGNKGINIIDAAGRIVSTVSGSSGTVDVRMLAPGAYTMRMLGSGATWRFIKD